MANNRIYYAIQQVRIGDVTDPTKAPFIHGLQTVGISTNFNLEQVFEMGQLEIYQNIEEVPEVEVTLNKVLDGHMPIYLLATENPTAAYPDAVAKGTSLAKRQNARCDVQLGIFDDEERGAFSDLSPISWVTMPAMYVSSVTYTFPVDGNFTEDVTLVGNDKVWLKATDQLDGGLPFSSTSTSTDIPNELVGVGRRQFLNMVNSRFPTQIYGVQSNGTLINGEALPDGDLNKFQGWSVHFQNITVSCDLGRESISELGRFAPYHRYATFPVEVTSEFEVISTEGDKISASQNGNFVKTGFASPPVFGADYQVATDTKAFSCNARFNLVDQLIYLETCEGTMIHLGEKNKLTSVNYSGGDTGGGNVTVTYSFSTYNDFYVGHKETSPNLAGTADSLYGSDMNAFNYKSID